MYICINLFGATLSIFHGPSHFGHQIGPFVLAHAQSNRPCPFAGGWSLNDAPHLWGQLFAQLPKQWLMDADGANRSLSMAPLFPACARRFPPSPLACARHFSILAAISRLDLPPGRAFSHAGHHANKLRPSWIREATSTSHRTPTTWGPN
jgi:hypothetical protein